MEQKGEAMKKADDSAAIFLILDKFISNDN